MTIIVIKDLPESIDLDRQAMLAITGGARTRGRPTVVGRKIGRTIFRSTGIINYPAGFASRPPVDANGKSTGNTPIK